MNQECPLVHWLEQASGLSAQSHASYDRGFNSKMGITFSCSITGSAPGSGFGLCKFESYWENFLCSDSSIGRVPAFQAGCCGFESRNLLLCGSSLTGKALD